MTTHRTRRRPPANGVNPPSVRCGFDNEPLTDAQKHRTVGKLPLMRMRITRPADAELKKWSEPPTARPVRATALLLEQVDAPTALVAMGGSRTQHHRKEVHS